LSFVIASCLSRPLAPVDGNAGGAGGAGGTAGSTAGSGARGGGGGVSGSGGNVAIGGAGGGGSGGSTTSGAGGARGGGGGAGGTGTGGTQVSGPPAAPRPIAPLSTATVTSQRPTLRWVLAAGTDGAHVEICHDRACAKMVTSFDVAGASGAPPDLLPSGVLFWHVFGASAGRTGTTPSATWEMTIGARSAPVVASWGTTPDVNGDGFADVLVGAVGGAASGAGRAYVYLGGPGGPSQTAATILTGGYPGWYFGGSLASAGDVNGDGYADVVVGAVGASGGSGQVYLYLGGATGLASSPAMTITGSDGFTASFGTSVASAGDVNGDGYADVVVGAYAAARAGRAYLFLGGAAGLSSSPAAALTGPDGSDGQFGGAVASAGDINADGFADVVIGARGVDGFVGRAYVYLGSAAGLGSSPSTKLAAPDGAARRFGNSVTGAGDVNGDGYADLVIAAPQRDAPRTYLYLGGAGGLSASPAATLIPPDVIGSTFGGSVANSGDVNGDGFADLVIGDGSSGGFGFAYVYLGGASGIGAAPSVTLFGIESGGNFGAAVATAGDVDGDGLGDVVVGANNVGNGVGRVYLYPGNAISGVSSSPATTLIGIDGMLSYYGSVVASAARVTPVDRTGASVPNGGGGSVDATRGVRRAVDRRGALVGIRARPGRGSPG